MIRTIYILWLRQLKRYIRSRSRMIGSLGQPLLFLLAGLPSSIFIAASLNPLTYCVDGLRGALAGQMHFGFGIDLGVLTGVTVLFLVVGSYLFSKIEI